MNTALKFVDATGKTKSVSAANPLPVSGGGGGGTGGAVTVTNPAAATATLEVVTANGTVAAGAEIVSFENRGSANATVAGGVLQPGGVVTFGPRPLGKLAAIAYVAAGTTLAIAKVA